MEAILDTLHLLEPLSCYTAMKNVAIYLIQTSSVMSARVGNVSLLVILHTESQWEIQCVCVCVCVCVHACVSCVSKKVASDLVVRM